MKNKKRIFGYKVFYSDFIAKEGNFKYAENKEFKHKGEIKICQSGFHFCLKASHCFNYYSVDSNNIVCEVEALGKVEYHDEDSKAVTDHIRIGKRLTWAEVLIIANEGKDNTGHSNTGNRNTGNRNTGNSNTGNSNTGNWNTGNWNTGYSNTGDSNTGNSNTGNSNTGYSNTGNSNTGNWNTGNSNTGYSNTGNRNTGVFCTGEKTLKFFNKNSDWTEEMFRNSKVFSLLRDVDTKLWIPESKMTDKEKEQHIGWKNAKGFYRDIPFKQAFSDKWNNWSEANRNEFKNLPNFDKKVFTLITSVKI